MKNKIYLICIIILAITARSGKAAGFSKDDAGTTSAQFLKLAPGARPAAMGEAFTGLADDINAIYWNPAGLKRIDDKEVSATRAQWIGDTSFNWLAYAQDALRGKLGISFMYLGSGDIQKYDNAGNARSETYNVFDSALTVSYAKKIKQMLVGINVKYLYSKLEDESAAGAAVDIGILKEIPGRHNISVGLAVQNIGNGLKFVKESAPLPLNVNAGIACKLLKERLILTSDLNFPSDYDASAHIGAEYKQKLGDFDVLPRLGYKTTNIRYMNALSGVSLGFGINFSSVCINYAWVPYWELGATHRIDIGFKFGSKTTKIEKIDYSDYSTQYACVDCVNIAARNIPFDFGNYTVQDKEVPILDTIAALIIKYDPYKVRISGHSDSREDKAFGKDLSFKRANFVMQYLTAKGVPQAKLSIEGYGSDMPIKPNTNESGRKANRRVEFVITEHEGQKEIMFPAYASLKESKELENITLRFGQSLFAENDYDKALKEFNKVLLLNPENSEAKEYIEKIEDIKIGKAGNSPDKIDKKISRMRMYFERGQDLFQQQKYREAIKQYEKVLAIDPMHVKSMLYILRAKEMLDK
jgi:outer membrane protein OmpA-like peptidoglycan-associated protein